MSSITRQPFGFLPDGRKARLFTITHKSGASASFCDYGARLVGLTVPDRAGELADVVWGYEDVVRLLPLGGECGRVCGTGLPPGWRAGPLLKRRDRAAE